MACLLLVPLADAKQNLSAGASSTVTPEEVETQLYFHLINIQDFPINTQVPQPNPFSQVSVGVSPATLTCASRPLAGTGFENTGGIENDYHTYRGYSSPSYVEYDNVENGLPRTHAERLLGTNITINETAGVAMHWFMKTTASVPTAGAVVAGTAGGPVANVVVAAEMRSGDAISVDDKAYDRGELMMQGRTEPVTLLRGQALGPTGQPSTQVHGEQTSAGYVYEFVVPFTINNATLSRHLGFNLRIDVFVDSPECNDKNSGTVMTDSVEPYLDETHLPRLTLRNSPALVITQPATVSETGTRGDRHLLVEWAVISPWGNYDVDVANATTTVEGPGDMALQRNHSIQRTHEHYHMGDPWQAGWALNLSQWPPRDGTYQATLTVPNLQQTALAVSTVEFRMEGGRLASGPGQELPAPPAALLVLALLGLALARRR